jgi:predicted Zn-dependent peptidase
MKIKTIKNKSKIARLTVTFDAGSKVESKTRFPLGTAHMVEHMMFKGTEKRNAKDIMNEVMYFGGSINAVTSHNRMTFELSIPIDNLDRGLDVISDILINSEFTEKEFEKEKLVVLEEESLSKDSPDAMIAEETFKYVFSNYLSEPVIGTRDSINKITIEHARKFKDRFLNIKNALVVFSSSMSNKDAKQKLESFFGKSNGRFKKNFKMEKSVFPDSKTISIERPGIDQSYCIIAAPSSCLEERIGIPILFLRDILCGGPSSRIWNRVREDEGLVYDISGGSLNYVDGGAFLIDYECSPENSDRVFEIVMEEIELFLKDGPTDEEIEKVRNQYKASLYMIYEDNSAMVSIRTKELCCGDIPFEEKIEMISSTNKDDILKAAEFVFGQNKIVKVVCAGDEDSSYE